MIIFSDFDKTIYFPDDEAKTLRNISAIQKWCAAGHSFSICSGRSLQSLRRMEAAKDLPTRYLVLDRGAIICDGSGNELHSFNFSETDLAKISGFVGSLDAKPIMQYYTLSEETLKRPEAPITKIRLYYQEEDVALKVYDEAMKTFPKVDRALHADNKVHPELFGYHCFVEITPVDAGKANAIAWVLEYEGLSRDEVLAIGDGRNDVDMLEEFDGFMPAGSWLSREGFEFHEVESLADLIEMKLS